FEYLLPLILLKNVRTPPAAGLHAPPHPLKRCGACMAATYASALSPRSRNSWYPIWLAQCAQQ
ncbi:MAG: hypothetical protein ACREQV_09070, partial [Candidatus Binatia bacterium]